MFRNIETYAHGIKFVRVPKNEARFLYEAGSYVIVMSKNVFVEYDRAIDNILDYGHGITREDATDHWYFDRRVNDYIEWSVKNNYRNMNGEPINHGSKDVLFFVPVASVTVKGTRDSYMFDGERETFVNDEIDNSNYLTAAETVASYADCYRREVEDERYLRPFIDIRYVSGRARVDAYLTDSEPAEEGYSISSAYPYGIRYM